MNFPTLPVFAGQFPAKGPKAIPLFIDFANGNSQYITLAYNQRAGNFGSPQAIFIDNSTNSNVVTVDMGDTVGMRLSIPPNSQGVFPIFSPSLESFNFTIAANGGECQVVVLNTPQPFAVWNGISAGANYNASGQLLVDNPNLDTAISGGMVAVAAKSYARAATLITGTATAAGATTIGTPAAASNLRKLILSIGGNAVQATAGDLNIQIALNGITLFDGGVYVPATALSNAGFLINDIIDFNDIAYNTGTTGGTLVATLANALTVGELRVQAHFDNG